MTKNLALLAALLAASPLANASMIDLTTPGSATVNGSIFMTTDQQSTGTGVIDPFLRVQSNGFEQGYNTSGSPLPFDDKPGAWTHDVRLGDTSGEFLGSAGYVTFLLDINQSNGGSNRYLSLDALQIYTSPTPSQTTTNVGSLGVLRYDLGSDNWVKLDASLSNGSGSGDLLLYVPASDFAGASANDYLYLYSAFGAHNSANGGFEEWSTTGSMSFATVTTVPAPGALALIGLGGLLVISRKR